MVKARREARGAGRLTTAAERRFVLLGTLLAVVITSLPYVVGAALSDDERVFSGFVYAVNDCTSYIAKMRQGAEGAWLFHIPYTPEPHPGALFFIFHRLLGKAATLLPWGDLTRRLIWVYHAARVAFGAGLLLTIYRFLALLTWRVEVRRLAWLLITFGGGLGWVLIALGEPDWLGSTPLDFILPEGFTFLVLFAFPHLALAQMALLLGLAQVMKAWGVQPGSGGSKERAATRTERGAAATRGSWLRQALLAGILWLGMGMIVPFYPAVAWSVTGAAWTMLCIRREHICLPEGLAVAVATLIPLPIVMYALWRFASDPVYATWAAQSQVVSPHPLHYALAYGVLLALGALAVRDAWASDGPLWVALAWIIVVPMLIYLPLKEQRRFVVGFQIPIAALAARGLRRVTNADTKLREVRWWLSALGVLLLLLPTNAMLIGRTMLAVRAHPSPIYRDRDEIATLDWLSRRVRADDVILASHESGNYIPARVGARVFVGHGAESFEASKKRACVARFFGGAADDEWRRELLNRYDVDYLFWGPLERELGDFDPDAAPYLERQYGQGGYVIFQVEL